MFKFFTVMTIFAIVFALSGCQRGGLTLGVLNFPVNADYEIVGSDFDEAFQTAYRSLEECNLEIYNSDKDEGKIYARVNRSADSAADNSRAFTTNATDFKFQLKQIESGNLSFNIKSKSSGGGQKYIDQFINKYAEYVELTDISTKNTIQIKPVITEIRTPTEIKDREPTVSEESSPRPRYSIRSVGQPVISETGR
jgi:hypothetical protein